MAKKSRKARYSKKLGTDICEDIAQGESLREACERRKLSHTTVITWLLRHYHPEFNVLYEFARKIADEMTEDDLKDCEKEPLYWYDKDGNKRIDTGWVQLTKIAEDRIKWVAARKQWRRWGDKPEIEKTPEQKRPILFESEPLPDRLKDEGSNGD